MSLNLSPGIEWTTYTWNPIVGCLNGCPYCYARQVAKRLQCPLCQEFKPHFHPERLGWIDRQAKRPGIVFLESMGDLFGPGVERDWVGQIGAAIAQRTTAHKVVTLTKRPDRIGIYADLLPDDLWVGVSITCQNDISDDLFRPGRLHQFLDDWPGKTFVSIEPLLGPVDIRRFLPLGDWDCYWCGWRGDETMDECLKCGEVGFFEEYDGSGYGICPECGSHSTAAACPVCEDREPLSVTELNNGLDWVIIGGLSGSWLPPGYSSKAALLKDQAVWANALIDQAKAANVPFFIKTKPVRIPGVPVIQEWPEDLLKYGRSWKEELRGGISGEMPVSPSTLGLADMRRPQGRGEPDLVHQEGQRRDPDPRRMDHGWGRLA